MCYLDYFSLLKVRFNTTGSVESRARRHMTSGYWKSYL